MPTPPPPRHYLRAWMGGKLCVKKGGGARERVRNPKNCVPKMAQINSSFSNFIFGHYTIWVWGGRGWGGGGGPPVVVRRWGVSRGPRERKRACHWLWGISKQHPSTQQRWCLPGPCGHQWHRTEPSQTAGSAAFKPILTSKSVQTHQNCRQPIAKKHGRTNPNVGRFTMRKCHLCTIEYRIVHVVKNILFRQLRRQPSM